MIEPNSGVVAFGPGLSDEIRDDICDLLQYADRMGNNARDRNENWKGWVDYHSNRLRRYGCEMRSTIATGPLFISALDEIEAINLNIHGHDDDPERFWALGAQALQKLDIYGFAETFFKHGRAGDTLQSWQVVPCERNRHGEIILMTVGVHVKTVKGHRAGGSSGPLDGEIIIRINGGVYLFQPHDYSAFFRDDIRKALIGTSLRRLLRQEL